MPECLRHYGLEERIKALIAKKCKGEKARSIFASGCAWRSAGPRSSAASRPRWAACRDWPCCACGRASCGHAWPWMNLLAVCLVA
ncbi:putative anti-sigma factor [Mycobacterium xenopi 3993]|nr:putative anti-sigma factor [Mycobacterium xenopi 3993]